MKARFTSFLLIILSCVISTNVKSQNSCGQATLDFALANYNIGRFSQVEEVLKNCLAMNAFSGDEDFTKKEDALRLLAMNALATDSVHLAKHYVEQLVLHNPNYSERSKDPLFFSQLITAYRSQDDGIKVISASKFEEKLEEAPAPMLVITAQDIKNRGYLDIEQVFHDIPGFTVARGNGPGYATIYPRGYRSTTNDRFLILVDGIEENDLNSDNAVTNRQMPLTNIKQIEVIYGPASTMYGANAYAAVVNIITKDKSDLFLNKKDFNGDIQVNYGTWNTQFIDANLNKKFKDGYFSFTTRLLKSDEMDLTNEGYRYEAKSAEEFQASTELKGEEAFNFYNNQLGGNPNSNFNYSANSGDTSLMLSDQGAQRMNALDRTFYDGYEGYDNSIRNWYFYGKLKLKGFTLGIESFRNNNGAIGWYPSSNRISGKDISRWITWNNFIYFKFNKKINNQLNLANYSSFRLHTIDGNTNLTNVNSYSNGALNFDSLLSDRPPALDYLYFFRSSNQLRNETKLFYQPNQTFNLITGIEFRSGIIQGEYNNSSVPNPNENSPLPDSISWIPGGNRNNTFDIGLYSQAQFTLNSHLSAVLGGRLDYNQVRATGGYGAVFNPRIALKYQRNDYILKLIYSEAFKDASFLQKYSTDPTTGRNLANPGLEPEKVKNLELSGFYRVSKPLTTELTGYFASYSNVVGIVETGVSKQYQAIGKVDIYGLQASVRYVYQKLSALVNYSFTQPFNTAIIDSNNLLVSDSVKRVSDIPSHAFNIILNYKVNKQWNVNLRSNFVGKRESGRLTSPSENPNTIFPDYIIFHSNINYEVIEGLTVGLLVNNVFDKVYYHPGIRSADGVSVNSRFLQNSRSFMLRANYIF